MRQRDWMCVNIDGKSYVEYSAYEEIRRQANQSNFERDQARTENHKLRDKILGLEKELSSTRHRLSNLDALYAEVESLRNQNQQLKRNLQKETP